MDILKEFEEYLPKWCHEHHLPVPTKQFSEHWKMAWDDYTKTVLMERRDEIIHDYESLPTYNTNMIYQAPIVEEIQEPEKPEPEPPKSDWEIVQALRKKK